MDNKRNEQPGPAEGPLLKIRKVVNLSPGVKELLKSKKNIVEGRLLVRLVGDEVYISLRVGDGNNLENAGVPREPRVPILIRQPQLQQQQPYQQQQVRRRPLRSAAGR